MEKNCETCFFHVLTEPNRNMNVYHRCKRFDQEPMDSVLGITGIILDTEKMIVAGHGASTARQTINCIDWVNGEEQTLMNRGW